MLGRDAGPSGCTGYTGKENLKTAIQEANAASLGDASLLPVRGLKVKVAVFEIMPWNNNHWHKAVKDGKRMADGLF